MVATYDSQPERVGLTAELDMDWIEGVYVFDMGKESLDGVTCFIALSI